MIEQDMNQTPQGNRVHIAIVGKRNAGKSTWMNALTGQDISVISQVAGTTTDPVYKSMELLPIGPVVLIDTAGYDDVGELGGRRTEKTYRVLRKTDFVLLILNAGERPDKETEEFLGQMKQRKLPGLAVLNQCEAGSPRAAWSTMLERYQVPFLAGSALEPEFVETVKKEIGRMAVASEEPPSLVEGVVEAGDLAVLVTPIDSAAPKGRIILPQQQTLRAILDKGAMAVVTKEDGLKAALKKLTGKPAVIITDSQAFGRVDADTPKDIPLTSFSILFAREKGELKTLAAGALASDRLKPGERVLIAEGCTHHRQSDDIGTVKIPRWLREKNGDGLILEWTSGTGFPEDLTPYALVIHCGACMLNRKEMQFRLERAKAQNVPITNYGMLIAYLHGILERALKPFPEVDGLWEESFHG